MATPDEILSDFHLPQDGGAPSGVDAVLSDFPKPPKTGFSNVLPGADNILGPQPGSTQGADKAFEAMGLVPSGGDVGAGIGIDLASQLVSSALPWYLKYPLKAGASVVGAYAGRPIGQYTRDVGADILSGNIEDVPNIPLPERNLTKAAIEGPAGLAMQGMLGKLGSKSVGQQTINEAQTKVLNAVGAAATDLRNKYYDDVAGEMVPEIAGSLANAVEQGILKGASGKKARGAIEVNINRLLKGTKEEPGLEGQVADLLQQRSINNKVDASVISDYLDQRIKEPGSLLEYIGKNYKDPTSQETADNAIAAFINRYKDLDSPLNDLNDLNHLKQSYQRLVNYNENLSTYDRINNTVNRKIAQFLRESIEDLSGGDDLVKTLNGKLGALYDVEGMISKATAKDAIIKHLGAGAEFSELYSSLPIGATLATYWGSEALAQGQGMLKAGTRAMLALSPSVYYTLKSYANSPSGLIKRAAVQDTLGRVSRGIGDWYQNRDLFTRILLDVTKDSESVNLINAALQGSGGEEWASQNVAELVKKFPELNDVFEPLTGALSGMKSYFGGKITDEYERAEYAKRISNAESSKPIPERDYIGLSKRLDALNRDGSVTDISVSPAPEITPEESPEPVKSSVVTGLADGVKITRSPYSY